MWRGTSCLHPSKLLFPTLHSSSPPTSISGHKRSSFSRCPRCLLHEDFDRLGRLEGKRRVCRSAKKPSGGWETMARPACFSTLSEPQTSSFCSSDLGSLCKSTLAASAGEPRDDLTNMVTFPAKEREKRRGECEKCFNWSRNLDSFRWDPFEKCAGNRMRWRERGPSSRPIASFVAGQTKISSFQILKENLGAIIRACADHMKEQDGGSLQGVADVKICRTFRISRKNYQIAHRVKHFKTPWKFTRHCRTCFL